MATNFRSLRDLGVCLKSELGILATYYRTAVVNREHGFTSEVFATVSTCSLHAGDYACAVTNLLKGGLQQASVLSYADELCAMIVEQGLDGAFLALLDSVSPLLRSTNSAVAIPGLLSAAVSQGQTSTPRVVAANGARQAGAASLRESTAAARALLSDSRYPGLGWEVPPDLQTVINMAGHLLTGFKKAIMAADSCRLHVRLLQDGILLQALDVINSRVLMHILFTKVLHHIAINPVDSSIFSDVCSFTVSALGLICTLEGQRQLDAVRHLPPNFLDTASCLFCCCLDLSVPRNRTFNDNIMSIAMLPASNKALAFAEVMEFAEKHNPSVAEMLAAALSTPCMQRIQHMALMDVIPRTALGAIVTCPKGLEDSTRSSRKEQQLFNINLLMESILSRLDGEHMLLNNGSSIGSGTGSGHGSTSAMQIQLGTATNTYAPPSSSNQASNSSSNSIDGDKFRSIWGSGGTEDQKLLLPKATSLGTLLIGVVRVGVWDTENWGTLCCRLVGSMLRPCERELFDKHTQSELGKAMQTVAHLASAVSLHVLKQQRVMHAAGKGRTNADILIRLTNSSMSGSGLVDLAARLRVLRHLHSECSSALRLMVLHMLRVGRFCQQSTSNITGFVGAFEEGSWRVTIKQMPRLNWLMMPGALAVIEMNMRSVCAAAITPLSGMPNNRSATLSSVSSDLISLISAHRGLLLRSWIGMMASTQQHGSTAVSPSTLNLSETYNLASAAASVSLTGTFCKLLLLAAGLATCPSGISDRISDNEGWREAAIVAEEVVCGELQQLVRTTGNMFTARAHSSISSPGESNQQPPFTCYPQPRLGHEPYPAGKLVYTTSLRMMLLLGRCCVRVAEGNRLSSWLVPAVSVAHMNNWNRARGLVRSRNLAGLAGNQVQALALGEAGAVGAAAYAQSNSDTFVLTLRSSNSHPLLHADALRACGFGVFERQAAQDTGQPSSSGFDAMLTLRKQTQGDNAEADAARVSTSKNEWERFSLSNLTGLAFPGCHHSGCRTLGHHSEAALPTLLCGGCRRARYCSVPCQRAAWISEDHAMLCAELQLLSPSPSGLGAEKTVLPAHPGSEQPERSAPSPVITVTSTSTDRSVPGFPTNRPEYYGPIPKPPSSISINSPAALTGARTCRSTANPITLAEAVADLTEMFGSRSSRGSCSIMDRASLEQPVVFVEATDLAGLEQLINSCTTPTTFDLGSRVYQDAYADMCNATDGSGNIDITANGVCLRNAVFMMGLDNSNMASLRLFGQGVVLENILVYGGGGIQIMESSEVTLNNCWVRNAHMGICTAVCRTHGDTRVSLASGRFTRLSANQTRVIDCRESGLYVGGCSKVGLEDCEFSGNIMGMHVSSNSSGGSSSSSGGSSSVRAKRVLCVNNSGQGVRLSSGVQVKMTNCTLTGNTGGAMAVDGPGACLLLANCMFDGHAVSSNGGRVEVRGRDFA